MKKISSIISAVILLAGMSSCELDTNPSNAQGSGVLITSVEGCMTALNGVYRGFYTTQYSEGYPTENFGPASVNLCADLMGEDMMEREPGSYWFTYDYLGWVRYEINDKSNRPYTWWNMFYQYVNNANAVLAAIETATGDDKDRASVKGQALALRAYAYFNLARWYQRTYVGHENDPGVPLYDKPTVIATEGKGRGKLSEVYTQINNDLDSAIVEFAKGSGQKHKSHIDIYVAYGLKSRVALVQEKWKEAADAAAEALKKPDLALMGSGDLLSGFNSVGNSEWMWGSEINEAQSTSWYSFFNHMDASVDGHARSCRKLVAKGLYDLIDAEDVRKQWFVAPTGMTTKEEDEAQTAGKLKQNEVSYNQKKFRVKAAGSWAADYIYMRSAEMVLNLAEALCKQGRFAEARTQLLNLGHTRYSNPAKYEARLAKLADSDQLNFRSYYSTEITTLMDEIAFQRRVELWGEGFRVHDITRMKTGMKRTYPNHNINIDAATWLDDVPADNWVFIMMIPIAEFDGNPAMNKATDQNPASEYD